MKLAWIFTLVFTTLHARADTIYLHKSTNSGSIDITYDRGKDQKACLELTNDKAGQLLKSKKISMDNCMGLIIADRVKEEIMDGRDCKKNKREVPSLKANLFSSGASQFVKLGEDCNCTLEQRPLGQSTFDAVVPTNLKIIQLSVSECKDFYNSLDQQDQIQKIEDEVLHSFNPL